MKEAGIILMLTGVAAALFAFAMDATVTSTGTYIAGTYLGGGSTYNLGLLQKQMMIFQGGLAVFLAGAVLFSGAARGSVADAQPRSGEIPPQQGHGVNLRETETEEQRDERVARDRRADKIALAIVGIGVVILVLVIWLSSPSSTPSSALNLDENLTTTDMNAVAETVTNDMNAH